MLLPLICVAGMYRWSLEQEIFTRDNAVKYLAVFGGLLFTPWANAIPILCPVPLANRRLLSTASQMHPY